ncbi:type IV pilus modification protein PilV [Chitinilyticum piscinae]|uniref:Type IV pilus modification protein PilV n=1 Tax=Chitinilyticum piscinae TaxID=2866724 RepID=A0A8J7K1V4_9NEIS|nr:type IV pilus modification protein PilV [Chitinilyticum piscinae]MBE9609746.1 type IV pilus modification protein PilV [Chitinilyticum piscinae]
MNTVRHLRQQGLSLIEVMLSVAILGIGLLGLAGLQTRAVMMNQSAYYRSIASDLAANLADRIRASRTPFLASSDADTQPPLPPDFARCSRANPADTNLTCTAQEAGHESYLVSNEMNEWFGQVQSQLPAASYTLQSMPGQSTGFYRYRLTISWTDDRQGRTTAAKNTSFETVIE